MGSSTRLVTRSMEYVTLVGMGSPWAGKCAWDTLVWVPSWAEVKDRDGFSSPRLAERFCFLQL